MIICLFKAIGHPQGAPLQWICKVEKQLYDAEHPQICSTSFPWGRLG